MSMATTLIRMGTYHEELPFIESHDPLIKWSCKIIRRTKKIYFHYKGVYGYQTWQDVNLPWRAPVDNVS